MKASLTLTNVQLAIELLDSFHSHCPTWGGNIVILDGYDLLTSVHAGSSITNTCSFDYLLLGLCLSTKISVRVTEWLVNPIQNQNFDRKATNYAINYI